jgi:hypothetical protein
MKYKVGDKVRVRGDLKENTRYGGEIFACDMTEYLGKTVEITKVLDDVYCIKGTEREWHWTSEMFEPVEEISAAEAIKAFTEICGSYMCAKCPIGNIDKDLKCYEIKMQKPEKVVEVIKQWKADHEKKEVEVTQKIYCLVVDEEREVVHEEEIGNSDSCMDVLKNYCENHDGKFFSLMEFRYEVKQ